MRFLTVALALVVGIGNLAVTAEAQTPPDPKLTGFRSPSGNIHCQFFKDDDQRAVLRCDIRQLANRPPPRPKDCDLDWGQAFEVGSQTPGRRICHGDTVMNDALAALAYGATWKHDGFTCRSERTGVTCANASGHGFELAKKGQRVF